MLDQSGQPELVSVGQNLLDLTIESSCLGMVNLKKTIIHVRPKWLT